MDYIKYIRNLVGKKPIILCACGCLIFNEKDEVLLQKRVDDGKWGNPGGYMELGETVQETVAREVFEETGLKVDQLKLFNIYSGEEQHHFYPNGDEVYLVNIVFQTHSYSGNLKISDGESIELKFFNRNEIPQNTTELFNQIKKDIVTTN